MNETQYSIPETLLQGIVTYLRTRPHHEVDNMLVAMREAVISQDRARQAKQHEELRSQIETELAAATLQKT